MSAVPMDVGAVMDRAERRLNELCEQLDQEPAEAARQLREARATLNALVMERDRLKTLMNNSQAERFLEATRAEIAHQLQHWSAIHDRAKEPQDWFWLTRYLADKALRAHNDGALALALHHTISSAAALANWHAAISMADARMPPAGGDVRGFLTRAFGGGYFLATGDATHTSADDELMDGRHATALTAAGALSSLVDAGNTLRQRVLKQAASRWYMLSQSDLEAFEAVLLRAQRGAA